VFFPKHREGAVPDARAGGKLVLDEHGCIRLELSENGPAPTPIWPYEYETSVEDGEEIVVLDGRGRMLARIGDKVYLSGGFVGRTLEGIAGVDPQTKRELRERCPGQYWYAAEMRRTDQ
jgi:hypothetical protein